MRRALVAILLLTSPAWAQGGTATGSRAQKLPSGTGGRVFGPGGMTAGAHYQSVPADVQAWYDATDASTLTKGAYAFNGTTQYLSLASCPVTAYPFTVAIWCRPTGALTGSAFLLKTDATNYHSIHVAAGAWSATSCATTTASSTGNSTATGAYGLIVGTFTSATARQIWVQGVAGALNTTSKAFGTPASMELGRDAATTVFLPGSVLGAALWNGVELSSAEIADLNQGWNPGWIQPAALAAGGYWPLDGSLAPLVGSGTWTNNASATAGADVVVWRDKVGSSHLVAGTGTGIAQPTYVASGLINSKPAVRFVTLSSRLVSTNGTAPVSAAPLQMYLLSANTQTTVSSQVFGLFDRAAGTESFQFFYNQTSDELQSRTAHTSVAFAIAGNYTANEANLLWQLETSATSRAAQKNGGTSGTDTTSKTPTGIDCVSMGGIDTSTANSMTGDVTSAMVLTGSSLENQPAIEAYYRALSALSIP